MLESGILASFNPIIRGTPLSLHSTKLPRTTKIRKHNLIACSSSSIRDKNQTVGGQLISPQDYKDNHITFASPSVGEKIQTVGGQLILPQEYRQDDDGDGYTTKMDKKGVVFLLDVNPLCYNGSTPSLRSFARWISLFFSRVSLSYPVIAVFVSWFSPSAFFPLAIYKKLVVTLIDSSPFAQWRMHPALNHVFDGDGANEYRRQLLPSYKAHRRKASTQTSDPGRFHLLISDVLRKCNVPVVKIASLEADDVIATLAEQASQRGYRVVIASPDKDFKQLISDDVQMVMPIPELKRWSFYTLKHYIAQYKCDPQSDLSLRCIMGDEVDGVPGIRHFVPGFGLKTALKLLKKHQSLENLLNAAAVRTVGKQYVQDSLTKYADHLRKNYEVLSLRRDINVHLEEEWLHERDASNDTVSLSNLIKFGWKIL